MKTRLFAASALTVAIALASGSVLAAAGPAKPACYTRAQHAAEQLIRMHAEMMTVGLYCKEAYPNDKPYDVYQQFTVDKSSQLSAAQKTMIGFFGSESRFNAYHTAMANEASRRVTAINPSVYCKEFIDRIKDAQALSSDQVRTLTSDETRGGLMHLSSRPLCDVKVVSLPDPVPTAVASVPPKANNGKTNAKPKPPAKANAKPPAKAPAKPVKTAALH